MTTFHDIEILTHCDVGRLNRAYLMAKTMPSELMVTLIIGFKDPKDKEHSLANKPDNINVYFEYYDPDTIYPTNRFRNIAFEKSVRGYVFYLDVDFIFQHDFWKNFEKQYISHLSPDSVLCPIPLFDELKPDYLEDYTPEELVRKETEATHLPIINDDFTKTATLFKFHDRWVTYPQEESLQDMTPVMRSIRNGTILPEPWGILHRDKYLFADESFLGRVKDKQQFVCRLLDSGLKFFGMRDCVMYHLWHPDSRHDINREKENCINTLLFNKKYLHKYQNFFFLLENDDLEEQLRDCLGKFKTQSPIVALEQGSVPEDVIPILKKRPTVISKSVFFPEYDVYGYKLIYVYNKDFRGRRLSNENSTKEAIYNLASFSMELDIDSTDLVMKKIQDITGWQLKKEITRVNTLSPGPEKSNVIDLM